MRLHIANVPFVKLPGLNLHIVNVQVGGVQVVKLKSVTLQIANCAGGACGIDNCQMAIFE